MLASLADPPQTSVLGAAVTWVEAALLGTVATIFAVIAIALLGLGMLSGRVDLRRGATVVLGCFILFGAAAIGSGIRASLETGAAAGVPGDEMPQQPAAPAPPAPPAPRAAEQDPYAGASVPSD
jgi:type IV secretory pathway VirB2 component (pilin)